MRADSPATASSQVHHSLPRRALRALFGRAESMLARCFEPQTNPLAQLGALGWFFYWIVAVTGIYLFVFFDTGVDDAYASVERITNEHWFVGSVMRSLHRYASDALVIVVLLHLLREWANDRMRGPRWFAWVTGIVVLWFLFAAGISGYWVVWDELAQYVALSTSEWLDSLGLFGKPIAHNFVHDSTLSGRFFTLMAFIHIAVPLVMLFLMWIHIQRQSRPGVNPPRALAFGSLAGLVVLSLVYPARSHGPADLSRVPTDVGIDWFYLAPLPLQDRYDGLSVWLAVAIATLVLLAAPWLPPRRRPVAEVNLDECNGCGRCVADCPYTAVNMRARSDAAAFAQEAVVDPSLCVSCGLCVGACPTATPFSRRRELKAGIELPDLSIVELRKRCVEATASLSGPARVVVFACRHGAAAGQLQGEHVIKVVLPCVGMLPPSFLDYLLMRDHVDGVLLTGCRDGACHERFGIEWTRQRIDGERDPYLRKRVPRERIAFCFVGPDVAQIRRELQGFRERLQTSAAAPAEATRVCTVEEVS